MRRSRAHRLVSGTEEGVERVLTGDFGGGSRVPPTRPHARVSGGKEEGAGGIPRTRIFTTDQIELLREEGISHTERVRLGIPNVEKILSDQNAHNLRLGDEIEVEEYNFGEPPEKWYQIAQMYEANIVQAQVTIHPEFSLSHPKVWHDGNGNWYYNFSGAVILSAVMDQRLPTVRQLTLAMEKNPQIFHQSKGYYDPSNEVRGGGKVFVHDIGSVAHFWVANGDQNHGNTATSLTLKEDESLPIPREINRRLFLPVRLIIEMSDEYYLEKMAAASANEP